jgi:hypothetical protein
MSFLSQSDINTMRSLLEVDLLDDVYCKNNLLSFFPTEGGEGDNWKIPVRIAGTTQHGADDVAGLAGVAGVRPAFGAMTVDWFPTYGFAQVPRTSIVLSQNKDTGAVPLMVDAVRDARKACARDLEVALTGDGFGTRFIITAETGSGPYVLTMGNVSDALPINIGDTLVSSAANNSASLDTGSFTIQGVDRDAGTATVVANNSWTPSVGHFCFLALDKVAAVGYSNPSKLYGLQALLPTVNRTSTLGGLDRSVDPQNLSGCYATGSATAIRASINRMIAKIMPKADADPSHIFMSSNTMMALQTELQNSVKYSDTEIEGHVNFPGISFDTTMGKAKAAFAIGIPDNLIYVLTRSSWKLRSPLKGDPVQSATNDGKDYIDAFDRVAATTRQWAFGALGCMAPGLNGVIALS